MSNKLIAVIFLSLPLATGVSYVLYKYYHKNVPPSIIGIAMLVLYGGVFYLFERKNEKS